MFETVAVLTQGGLPGSGTAIVYYICEAGFTGSFRIGYAPCSLRSYRWPLSCPVSSAVEPVNLLVPTQIGVVPNYVTISAPGTTGTGVET